MEPHISVMYTHTPGGKPAPGFTFGIARPLIGPATMSQDQMAGGTAHPDGQRWIRRSRTTNCRLEKLPSLVVIVSMRICQRCFH